MKVEQRPRTTGDRHATTMEAAHARLLGAASAVHFAPGQTTGSQQSRTDRLDGAASSFATCQYGEAIGFIVDLTEPLTSA